jgi:hypothetical protein
MNPLCHCVLVIASLVTFERVSFARPTAPGSVSHASSSLAEPALLDWLNDEHEPSRSNDEAQADAVGGEPFGLRLCHISHHPRDGVRPALQACPLFVASYRRIDRFEKLECPLPDTAAGRLSLMDAIAPCRATVYALRG